MSIQSAASRQCINLRGGSNDEYYARMLVKAIYDIQHFKTLFYKCGTYIPSKPTEEERKFKLPPETREMEKSRMAECYKFMELKYGEPRDISKYKYVRKHVISNLEEQKCCICLSNRLEVEQPNMFLLTDCSHLCCSRCSEQKIKVSSINLFFLFLSFG